VRPLDTSSAEEAILAERPALGDSWEASSQPDPSRHVIAHLALIVTLALVWAWSLTQANEADLGGLGVITILPPLAFLCLAGMIAGFVHALYVNLSGRLFAAYVVGLTLMIHGLPTFVYDHLRFSWAWKHVGIVEYILRTGGVDTHIGSLPVYHNWPGFFGLNAWIVRGSGVDSPMGYATWAPILFNLLYVLTLVALFRGFSPDRRLVWAAALIFELGNWIGQDYFAPQALAFFLYLVVITILLRWFSTTPHRTDPGADRALEAGSLESMVLSGVVLISLLAITISHQLTPIVMILALATLRLFKVIRVSWPLVAIVIFSAAWALGPARDFVFDNVQKVTGELGGFQANLDNNLSAPALFNRDQFIVSSAARLLSAAIVGVAGLGLIRRRNHKLSSRWVILLAVVPSILILASSYGGEILFRAYLFALPFGAFLAASLWFPVARARPSVLATCALAGVLMTFTAGLLVADFGIDNRLVFNNDEVAAADFVTQNARPGALVIEGTRDYPRQYRRYEQFVYLTIDRLSPEALEKLTADPADTIASWLRDTDAYNGGYVILTGSQRQSVTALGTSLPATLDAIEGSLAGSDQFETVFRSGDAIVFGLKEDA
jgi:hypothetical protein